MHSIRKKRTTGLPVHRVVVLAPFTQFLEDIGAPVEKGFRKARLPLGALEDMDNYVPSTSYWKFLILMTRAEGIMDLGFRVGEQYGARCGDPCMSELLNAAPTLYQGLIKALNRINRSVTNCRMGILQPPNRGCAYFYHSPSCTVDNPAIEQLSWYGLCGLLGMVRVFTGPQWQPAEIGLIEDNIPNHYIQEHFPNTRFRLSQPVHYMTVEDDALSLPPFAGESALPAPSTFDYQPVPGNFCGTFEAVLLSYIEERDLSLQFAAELCDLSKRSLQRKLTEVDTSYNELLSHARFRAASRMLQDLDTTATEVAIRLGYSDVAHFARAFRRIAGVSPTVYRQQFNQ